MTKGFAYQIKRQDNNEVLFEGILRHSEDTIYPAQEEPYLKEEFPELPYEVEFYHFKVPGLYTEGFYFSVPITGLLMWKD